MSPHEHSVTMPSQLTPQDLAPSWIVGHMRRRWTILGGIGVVITLVAFFVSFSGDFAARQHFFRAYLIGFMFCLGLTLGSMAMLMLSHVTGGKWGFVLRRIFEAATRNFLLVVLLFIPIMAALTYIYPWAGDLSRLTLADRHAIDWRGGYFVKQNLEGIGRYFWFYFRAVVYFIGRGLLIFYLNRWSRLYDEPPASSEASNQNRLRLMRLGGGGLVFWSLTISLASIDWVMSLSPAWYSTIWGMIYMVGEALAGLAWAILILVLLAKYEPMKSLLRVTELHDNGKLLLAFVMLYTYVSWSQFLIIWSGNLVEEIPWYVARMDGKWHYVGLIVVIFHFALPFLLLLNRSLKKRPNQLATVAIVLLLARIADLLWHVVPSYADSSGLYHRFLITWMDIMVPLSMAAVWIAFFFWELGKRPLLPAYHPLLPEILEKSHGH
jgi:hypothetical protein